jgi:hypothetical protein
MLATINLFREAAMTAHDNAYRATGTGNPHVDFFAIPGDGTQPAPIWGFLTRDNRFGIGGSFDGFVYGAGGHGGHPDDNARLGRIIMTIRGTPACSVRGSS